MSGPTLRLLPPDGRVIECPVPDGADPSVPLSVAIERAGLPLNTRCGGRGLCRGCLVRLGDDPEPVRSCRLRPDDLPDGIREIHIPAGSLADRSLYGVSAFEIRGEQPVPRLRDGHGLSIDIGTTTVAAALWDLRDGTCLGTATRANAQARHGDNVLSRVEFACSSPDAPETLRRALVDETLTPLIESLCARARLRPDAITEGTAAGNPAMLHTLAGLPLDGLATYPFRPVFLESRSLDLPRPGGGRPVGLWLLPSLGPFVGADIVAGALATGVFAESRRVLLIDFGTNGEILLATPDGCLATATAAGPAFDGGRLRCGAPARRGVISGLTLVDGRWKARLVPGSKGAPQAISGAAYIDFLALARRHGLINGFGRIDPAHPLAGSKALDGGMVTAVHLTETLFVTEADVAELLQAKAAVAGGIATLLELAGLSPSQLDAIHVAGGFGYHLNPEHARQTGLLPDVETSRIDLIGNASLAGASLLLLDRDRRESLARTIPDCRIIELNQTECFEDHFTDAMGLPVPAKGSETPQSAVPDHPSPGKLPTLPPADRSD